MLFLMLLLLLAGLRSVQHACRYYIYSVLQKCDKRE